MTTVPGTYDTLLSQSESTVEGYFIRACLTLDKEFGDGYARLNPALVGQLVAAMARDFSTASFGKVVGELADIIRDKDFHG